MEATALGVEALTKMDEAHANRDTQEMACRGLQYLLAHKDRYAVWYSTQATQNVLEAMIATMPIDAGAASVTQATIKVNGHALKTLSLPDPGEATGPITVALANGLERGKTRLKL